MSKVIVRKEYERTIMGNTDNPKYAVIFSTTTGDNDMPAKPNSFKYLLDATQGKLNDENTAIFSWLPVNKKPSAVKAYELTYKTEATDQDKLLYGSRKKVVQRNYIQDAAATLLELQPEYVLTMGLDLSRQLIGEDWNSYDKLESNHGTFFKISYWQLFCIEKNHQFWVEEQMRLVSEDVSDWTDRKITERDNKLDNIQAYFKDMDTYYDEYNNKYLYIVPTFELQKSYDWFYKSMIDRDLERFVTINPHDAPVPEFVLNFDSNFYDDYDNILDHSTIYLDIETTGLDYKTDKITQIGWIVDGDTDVVNIVREPSERWIRDFLNVVEETQSTVIGHNIKFDLTFLFWKAKKVYYFPVQDSMIAGYMYGELRINLKHFVSMYTDRIGNNGLKQGDGFDSLLYLAEDVVTCKIIHHKFYDLIDGDHNYAYWTICNLIIPTIRMQFNGMQMDVDLLKSLESRFLESIEQSHNELKSYIPDDMPDDINFKGDDLIDFLLANDIPLKDKTATGKFKTDVKTLGKIKHPVIDALFLYRQMEKAHGTYIKAYLEKWIDHNGRIHPELDIRGTDTGRLSGRNPNPQNVPNMHQIKATFVSRFKNGYIALVDFAKAELKIAAYVSGDVEFAKACSTGDVYRNIASLVFHKPVDEIDSKLRSIAKTIVLGLMYGSTIYGMSYASGVPVDELTQVVDDFFGQFSSLNRWLKFSENYAIEHKLIPSRAGRIRRFDRDLYHPSDKMIAHVKRQGTNTPIQSLSSDLLVAILINIDYQLKQNNMKTVLINAVHDSILADVHPDEVEQYRDVVQRAFVEEFWKSPLAKIDTINTILPMTGDLIFAKNWLECEDKEKDENGIPFFNPVYEFSCSSHDERFLNV